MPLGGGGRARRDKEEADCINLCASDRFSRSSLVFFETLIYTLVQSVSKTSQCVRLCVGVSTVYMGLLCKCAPAGMFVWRLLYPLSVEIKKKRARQTTVLRIWNKLTHMYGEHIMHMVIIWLCLIWIPEFTHTYMQETMYTCRHLRKTH